MNLVKDCVENSTTADPTCNDTGCAVAVGLAKALESPAAEFPFVAYYSASITMV